MIIENVVAVIVKPKRGKWYSEKRKYCIIEN